MRSTRLTARCGLQVSFPELPEVLFWFRQILAIVVGIAAGVVPLTGWAGIIACVGLCTPSEGALRRGCVVIDMRVLVPVGRWILTCGMLVYGYYRSYLELEYAEPGQTEDDGVSFDSTKLLQEGLMQSFGTFLVRSTCCVTPVHPNGQPTPPGHAITFAHHVCLRNCIAGSASRGLRTKRLWLEFECVDWPGWSYPFCSQRFEHCRD